MATEDVERLLLGSTQSNPLCYDGVEEDSSGAVLTASLNDCLKQLLPI